MIQRSIVLLWIFILVATIAVQTGQRLFFSMAYLFGGTLVLSFFWGQFNKMWVGISRLTSSLRVQVGNPIEERIVIRNLSYLPKLWIEVQDASELPEHRVSRVVHGIGPKRTRSWSVKTNARYRGRYRLGPMRLISGDAFGLFTFKKELPQTSSITIVPATYDLPYFSPPIGRLTGGETMRRRTHNTTPNFAGVREYMPGDSMNRIHWRSTARTGRLIVKEFEEDPSADIWVVLDMHRDTHFETEYHEEESSDDAPFSWLEKEKWPEIMPATTEYAVTAAASLIKYFLDQNRAVGMIAHAATREIMQPDRGQRPLNRALEYLAVLQAEGDQYLEEVLTLEEQFFTRGTSLVIVTSYPYTNWIDALYVLKRRGVQPIVVLINPASFKPYAPSMDNVIAGLVMAGIPTYMINKDDKIPDALSTPVTG